VRVHNAWAIRQQWQFFEGANGANIGTSPQSLSYPPDLPIPKDKISPWANGLNAHKDKLV